VRQPRIGYPAAVDTLFFIVSKLAWALISPETWILLLVLWTFLALLTGRLRAATWLSGGAASLVLLAGVLPLGSVLLRPLETSYPANPDLDQVVGIIVLGGGENAELSDRWGQPQVNEAGDRFLAALSLAQQFPEASVLFTGGIGSLGQNGRSTGADVAETLLRSAGLSPERLLLERTSRNTAENARNSLALSSAGQGGPWVLVTSAFHMPRAIETFCAAGWTDVVPWPVDFRTGDLTDGIRWGVLENLGLLDLALKEYVGRLAYRHTGRSAAADCVFAGDSAF
jgi:uncharacterized SAM-binding protein YcdF (DUF218 family)